MPRRRAYLAAIILALLPGAGRGQSPPSAAEISAYTGLHAAAAAGDVARLSQLAARGDSLEARDGHRRTPLHVAVHAGRHEAVRALLRHGADPNAFDAQKYDPVTIAAVRDDVEMLRLLLAGGASARNVTSPYDGTALIAAAHLGHAEIVRVLIEARAPLDHVNNLGWTALIESIVLGDGGSRHTQTLAHLLAAGADPNIADRSGATPLALARARGYAPMARMLEAKGAR